MLFCYELNSNKFDLKTQFHCTIHGVPLLATFAAFFFARRPRGTPAGAAETHAPAAPASARLWAAALRGCAAQPRVLLRPQQTTAECATAGATSTNATGRRARLRRARQAQLRRGASSTFTRARKSQTFISFIIE